MSIQPQTINDFLENRVKDGSCRSIFDAEKEVMKELISRNMEREIRIGEEQIEKGQCQVLNDKFIKKFVADLAKELLPQKARG